MIVGANHPGASGDLAQATNDFNGAQNDGPSELLSQHLGAFEDAGILGPTYRSTTDVIELAAGLLLAGELTALAFRVMAFDSERRIPISHKLGASIQTAVSAEKCIAQREVTMIATRWPTSLAIPAERWTRVDALCVVIDCWRALKPVKSITGVVYLLPSNSIVSGESATEGAAQ